MSILFAVATLLATGVLVATLVALHALPTGVRPVADPVSQYGITKYAAGYRIAAVAAAAAGVAAAFSLADQSGSWPLIPTVLLLTFAAARIAICFFPMDEPGASRTTTGRTHNLLAFAAFGTITANAFICAGLFADAGMRDAAYISTFFAIVMAIGSVGTLLSSRVESLRRWFGLAERLIYVGFIGWFVLVGVVALVS